MAAYVTFSMQLCSLSLIDSAQPAHRAIPDQTLSVLLQILHPLLGYRDQIAKLHGLCADLIKGLIGESVLLKHQIIVLSFLKRWLLTEYVLGIVAAYLMV